MRKGYTKDQTGNMYFYGNLIPEEFVIGLAKTGGFHCGTPTDIKVGYFRWIANIIHGGYYDFSNSVYEHSHLPVVVSCPEHGVFASRASHILEGKGCHECGITRMRKPASEFIKEAIVIHGDKYNYSKVVYINNKLPVIIICKEHGEFLKRPSEHLLAKSGCPICSSNKDRNSQYIYIMKTNIDGLYKIGISADPYRRARELGTRSSNNISFTVLYSKYIGEYRLARKLESDTHKKLFRYNIMEFTGDDGYTEMFTLDPITLESVRQSVCM